jgi:hypothetical protein
MRMKLFRTSFGLAFGTFLIASTAFADQFYFASPGTVVWNGVYVNPYQADDNTQPQNNPLTIYCDDWNTEFSGNPTWNAYVYKLTPGNVSQLKFGQITSAEGVSLSNTGFLQSFQYSSPNVYDLYLEAAYLDSELQADLASHPANNITQEELAAANWLLFVNSSNVAGLVNLINGSGSPFATDVYNDLLNARSVVTGGGFNGAGWDVIVPGNNSFPMQEFLVDGFNGVTAPEPSAVILLGSVVGLLGLIEFRRRRKA